MTSKAYLVHIYQDGDYLTQVPFYGRNSLCEFLRECGGTFYDGNFSGLGDDSVFVSGDRGISFEIEELLDDGIEHAGTYYLPIKLYCQKYSLTRRQAVYAVKTGKVDSILVGDNQMMYVRDNK